MTERERILAVLDGRAPDRIPWVPRLKLWYRAKQLTGALPDQWKGYTQREVERALGVGTAARDGKVFDIVYDGVDIVEQKVDGKSITEYHTPKGMVRSVKHFSDTLDEVGLPGRIEEHVLKGPDDYRVWEYVVQHMRWEPCYDACKEYEREIGEEGLPMLDVGDVPFHEFAQALAGYGQAFYQLADFTKEVEHLLEVMTEVQRERLWPVLAKSPARLFRHGSHLSSQMTPPSLFEKYIIPYYRDFLALMHESGKSVAMHADADTSMILSHIERAGWDIVECFVTSPMVPLTMEKARKHWGNRMIIWGGIPSTLLSPSVPEDEFRSYMRGLFKTIAPGDAFILGVADNVMPDSIIDRVAWISDFVNEYGVYPLS
jgi:uroporphyrinogen-III decarboxylase